MKDTLFDITGKIIVITGGFGQIGAEFVKEFHERGARIAIFSRSADEKRKLAVFGPELAASENLSIHSVNIADKASIDRGLKEVVQQWGTPEVLVNNAGIDTQPSAPPEVSGPFEQFPEEVFREVIEVNLVGTFLMTQAVGALMIANTSGGSIINIGSIYGMVSPVQDIYAYKKEKTGVPFIKPVAYSAAKSGLYNLTRYCATYWGRSGIRVNILTPSGVFRETQDEEFQRNYCQRMPMGRMAQADEYNGAVIFLASDASKYMTGANLVVDGGWTAW
ncbi:MAG TPA: short-chain dehydrogenase [Sphaerochaeta sp.]|jgi:NAD(P)-dependent dehydrogenase (short-subunit alcohol dehydrogenase family)|nr:SDR family oxidoreductase [Sphaerochaeta sp.]PKL21210.1 MAG: short-chain dehydrogenase [Spirochaetae bacterium HGW-Spirochaetae-4]PKL25954.1 MAG: short-chain dehydrogenase [Spirochaetae bacterium HGW-Spirochaetae-2]HCJ94771.1 short-chain dehydrogenase [Sphaerochaeta sp.]